MVRVRFAPSPTGHLHIGAARTSLFNWLFARHHKGKFILRVEDTDVARSSDNMSRGIIEGLKWLGLDWDEGPVFQSRKIEVYKKTAEELVKGGYAYYCYCLPEEIQRRKKQDVPDTKYWMYDRRCLKLSNEEKNRFEREKRPKAIRFMVPEGELGFKDQIHGYISVDCKTIEDFVLLRGDGLPTYHLSVVVDDIEQAITHVIRGDDHISNTPKQILLYKALGALLPEFAHLALILGPDKRKLSKRHGEISVLKFKEDGYLPLALLNFLAQMSWTPGKEEKIFSVKELIAEFSLDRLSKGSPVFRLDKLEWFSGQLISQMSAEKLAPYVTEELKRINLWEDELGNKQKEWLLKLTDLLKERSRTINQLAKRTRPYLSNDFDHDPAGIDKYLCDDRLESLLPKLEEDFAKMRVFSAEEIEKKLRQRAEREEVKAALFIHALRMLVVGEPVSPSIFEVLELVGKNRTIDRMRRFPRIRRK